eukprot:scaffold808_cov196-Alexandrium_tamarense.AAC.25
MPNKSLIDVSTIEATQTTICSRRYVDLISDLGADSDTSKPATPRPRTVQSMVKWYQHWCDNTPKRVWSVLKSSSVQFSFT